MALKKFTEEHVLKRIEELAGDEYIVTGVYKNIGAKTLFKHVVCGRSFEATPDKFINKGQRCSHCYRDSRLSAENFKDKVFERYGDEWIILTEYVNNSSKIRIKHNVEECGMIFEKTSHHFYQRNQLCECQRKVIQIARQREAFEKKIYDDAGDEYSLVGEYNGCENYVTLLHHECGEEFKLIGRDFYRRKQRCTFCHNNFSKGESLIFKLLNENGIKYEKEYKFQDCRSQLPLPFDFAIVDSDNSVVFLVEFDGKQHFEPYGFGCKNEDTVLKNFNRCQENDIKKNQYCISHSIPLIRIPYWELNNTAQIIKEALCFYNLTDANCLISKL